MWRLSLVDRLAGEFLQEPEDSVLLTLVQSFFMKLPFYRKILALIYILVVEHIHTLGLVLHMAQGEHLLLIRKGCVHRSLIGRKI